MDFSSKMESGLLESIGREFISSNNDLKTLLNNVFNILVSYYKIERGLISISYKDVEDLSIEIYHGYTADDIERGFSKYGEGFGGQSSSAVIIPDIRNDLGFLNRAGSNRNIYANRISFIYIPVIIDNNVIGGFSIEIINNSGRDLEEEINMLKTISLLTAQAVNSRMAFAQERYLRTEYENLINKIGAGASPSVIVGLFREIKESSKNSDSASGKRASSQKPCDNKKLSLEERTNLFEKDIIIESLRISRGNISRAAKELGTTKRILGYKMSNLGIDYRFFRRTEEDQ